jgi:hypothetical protein
MMEKVRENNEHQLYNLNNVDTGTKEDLGKM